jgi:ABC-type sugar transport system permease subunit
LRTTFTFEAFDEIFSMTKGGPASATWIAAWYTYSVTFKNFQFGLGAASAYIFGIIVIILAIIYVLFLYRSYTYQ